MQQLEQNSADVVRLFSKKNPGDLEGCLKKGCDLYTSENIDNYGQPSEQHACPS